MGRKPSPSSTTADAPFHALNTTPLIDVMLVLLILCIVSIPMMNHKVMIRLPGPPPLGLRNEPVIHRLTLDDQGRFRWNGDPISLTMLPRLLETVERNPLSVLEISASGRARYEDYDRMLVVVKRSGIDRIDLAGNARFASDLDR